MAVLLSLVSLKNPTGAKSNSKHETTDTRSGAEDLARGRDIFGTLIAAHFDVVCPNQSKQHANDEDSADHCNSLAAFEKHYEGKLRCYVGKGEGNAEYGDKTRAQNEILEPILQIVQRKRENNYRR